MLLEGLCSGAGWRAFFVYLSVELLWRRCFFGVMEAATEYGWWMVVYSGKEVWRFFVAVRRGQLILDEEEEEEEALFFAEEDWEELGGFFGEESGGLKGEGPGEESLVEELWEDRAAAQQTTPRLKKIITGTTIGTGDEELFSFSSKAKRRVIEHQNAPDDDPHGAVTHVIQTPESPPLEDRGPDSGGSPDGGRSSHMRASKEGYWSAASLEPAEEGFPPEEGFPLSEGDEAQQLSAVSSAATTIGSSIPQEHNEKGDASLAEVPRIRMLGQKLGGGLLEEEPRTPHGGPPRTMDSVNPDSARGDESARSRASHDDPESVLKQSSPSPGRRKRDTQLGRGSTPRHGGESARTSRLSADEDPSARRSSPPSVRVSEQADGGGTRASPHASLDGLWGKKLHPPAWMGFGIPPENEEDAKEYEAVLTALSGHEHFGVREIWENERERLSIFSSANLWCADSERDRLFKERVDRKAARQAAAEAAAERKAEGIAAMSEGAADVFPRSGEARTPKAWSSASPSKTNKEEPPTPSENQIPGLPGMSVFSGDPTHFTIRNPFDPEEDGMP